VAKPKADAWLRESFRFGVDERYERWGEFFAVEAAYPGAKRACWLAKCDPHKLPCGGQPGKLFERFHFIPRQRVENAMGAVLPRPAIDVFDPESIWTGLSKAEIEEVILLAAWDARNGGMGCELHHRRYDSHADSPEAPAIEVPAFALPEHFDNFVEDFGLETEAERRFPGFADPERAYMWDTPIQ
jgi:hypothetical protein